VNVSYRGIVGLSCVARLTQQRETNPTQSEAKTRHKA
jgi:hypothetical protein